MQNQIRSQKPYPPRGGECLVIGKAYCFLVFGHVYVGKVIATIGDRYEGEIPEVKVDCGDGELRTFPEETVILINWDNLPHIGSQVQCKLPKLNQEIVLKLDDSGHPGSIRLESEGQIAATYKGTVLGYRNGDPLKRGKIPEVIVGCGFTEPRIFPVWAIEPLKLM